MSEKMSKTMNKTNNLIWPDYDNCLANLPNSILKKWNLPTVGKSLSLADKYLQKEYKNVVVLILDGMGKVVIERLLDEDGPFRSHLAGIYKSVFLSTTVAATTSAITGLQPCEHSWLGWDCYYPQIDKNVTVFLNTIQGTETSAADYNVAWNTAPYESVVSMINNAGGKAYECTPFITPNPGSIEEVCAAVKARCEETGKKYIYAYWKHPDGLLHRHGGSSPIVKEALENMEMNVAKLAKELDDTLIFVTADHGHIDTDYVMLKDYPTICDCLIRWPSLEPRVLNFFVIEEKRDFFEAEFTKEFGDKFMLLPMEEVIEKNLFGTGAHHENFRAMLGDYLAIATSNLTIFINDEKWVSMHGSLTEDEMLIPLIAFDTNEV